MARPPLEKNAGEWQPISTVPLDFDLELGIFTYDEIHAFLYPCRRIHDGWLKAETSDGLTSSPRVQAAVAKSCNRKSTLVSSGRSMSSCPIATVVPQCSKRPQQIVPSRRRGAVGHARQGALLNFRATHPAATTEK